MHLKNHDQGDEMSCVTNRNFQHGVLENPPNLFINTYHFMMFQTFRKFEFKAFS